MGLRFRGKIMRNEYSNTVPRKRVLDSARDMEAAFPSTCEDTVRHSISCGGDSMSELIVLERGGIVRYSTDEAGAPKRQSGQPVQ
jgi:hypothetical protein